MNLFISLADRIQICQAHVGGESESLGPGLDGLSAVPGSLAGDGGWDDTRVESGTPLGINQLKVSEIQSVTLVLQTVS